MNRNNPPPFPQRGHPPTNRGYAAPQPRLPNPAQFLGQGIGQQMYPRYQQPRQYHPPDPASTLSPYAPQQHPHPLPGLHQPQQRSAGLLPQPRGFGPRHQPHQQPQWLNPHQQQQQQRQYGHDHPPQQHGPSQHYLQGPPQRTRRPRQSGGPRGDGDAAGRQVPAASVIKGARPRGPGTATGGPSAPPGDSLQSRNQPTTTAGINPPLPATTTAGSGSRRPASPPGTVPTHLPADAISAGPGPYAEGSPPTTGSSPCDKAEGADEHGLLQDSHKLEDSGESGGPGPDGCLCSAQRTTASRRDPQSATETGAPQTAEGLASQRTGTGEAGAQGHVLDTRNQGQVEDTRQDCSQEAGQAANAKGKKASKGKKAGHQQEAQEAAPCDKKGQAKGSDKAQQQRERAKEYYDSEMREKTTQMLGIDPNKPSPIFIPPVHFNRSVASWGVGVRAKDKTLSSEQNDPDPPTSDTPTSARDPDQTSDLASDRAEQVVERCLKTIADATPDLQMSVIFNYAFDNYLVNKSSDARKKHDHLYPDAGIKSSSASAKTRRASPPASWPSVLGDPPSGDAAGACEMPPTADEILVAAGAGVDTGCVTGLSSPIAGFETTDGQVSPPSSHARSPETKEGEPSVAIPAETGSKKKKNKSKKKKERKNEVSVDQPTTLPGSDKGGGGGGDEAVPSTTNDATDELSQSPSHTPDRSASYPALPPPQGAAPSQGPKSRVGKPNPLRQFHIPRPLFPNPEQLQEKRGDIDTLVVHQDRGCVIMEIKAVGYNFNNSANSKQVEDVRYKHVRDKISQGLEQLEKAEKFIRHVFSDLVNELPVKKALALPNVTRRYILNACSDDHDLLQKLCQCLCTQTVEEALNKVLCADDIESADLQSPSSEVGRPTASPVAILRWWCNVIKEGNFGDATSHEGAGVAGPEERLPQLVYEKMVARLAGPYSRVTVEICRNAAEARTVADCVHLTGLRFGRSLLRDDQQRILDSKEPFVYITGPPGSGKTLLLGFKGVEWARQGDHVVVFIPQGSGWGKLISQTLYQRIKEYASLPAPPPSGQSVTSPRKRVKESKSQFSLMPPTLSTTTGKKVADRQSSSGPDNAGSVKASASAEPQAQESPVESPSTKSESGSAEREAVDDKVVLLDAAAKEATLVHRAREDKAASPPATDPAAGNDREIAHAGPNPATSQTTPLPNRDEEDDEAASDDSEEAAQAVPVSVHTATVKKTDDTKKFVDDLLAEYNDQPLRVLVDEGPNKVNEKFLHDLLEEAARQMKVSRETLGRLVQEELGKDEIGDCGSAWGNGHGSRKEYGDIKALIKKNEHHLHTTGERLQIFQPSHGRPPVTQTERWQTMVTEIAACRRDILSFLDRLDSATGPQEEARPSEDKSAGPPEEARPSEDKSAGPPEEARPSEDKSARPPEEARPSEDKSAGTPEEARPSEDKSAGPPEEARPSEDKSAGPQEGAKAEASTADKVAEISTRSGRVLAGLDKLEEEMLHVSGRLFNVETQLDFLVIRDVLSLLVMEKGKRDVSVWSSGVTEFYKPENFAYEKLTHCLRCPPKVQRVLDLVEKDMADCPNYSYIFDSLQYSRFPLPTDGPEVKWLDHSGHLTQTKDILDCPQCGANLVDYLVNTLRVGSSSSGLQAEDVNISGSLDICSVQESLLLKTLEDQGIQLQFEQQGLTSPPPYPGKAFVVGGCSFQGLESKVVVFIPDVSRIPSDTSNVKQFRPDLPPRLKTMGRWNRTHLWFVASRCLSQLIVFHV